MFERIREIIAEQLNMKLEDITENASLKDLGLDDLDIVEIEMSLEEEFEIVISDVYKEWATVKDIMHTVMTNGRE